jgi:hypothetical protein
MYVSIGKNQIEFQKGWRKHGKQKDYYEENKRSIKTAF